MWSLRVSDGDKVRRIRFGCQVQPFLIRILLMTTYEGKEDDCLYKTNLAPTV
ncbi:hypothetical protein RO3G_02761 [Rhizopus delemar RA 99-880]|uniref:Uncharacterized protein n=1 Tax=Rhizopus delemar (strain RA 99-880 / ATCC MYA-4621 / FGSC 9543 / NRRL 43880) TaxID=246409 RepID=I1BPC7_RHIO9|nr:hypothetical protein RO3G_02761 [Rhizopus delemar RA 99-880]|eukprot:EIE78057.1 hypothetical protein RO3G_02761 [Rhizopus delemar RA 99-880]